MSLNLIYIIINLLKINSERQEAKDQEFVDISRPVDKGGHSIAVVCSIWSNIKKLLNIK